MTHTALVNKMLDKGLTYKEATARAREIEERASYLTKTLGAVITVEDVLEEA